MAAIVGGDEAIRERTITHMNHLHTRELTHYLRHYCRVTKRQSAGASLRDLTLQGMRIRAAGADHVVDFNPPLPSWDHVRPRLIEMDAVARQGLGISDIQMDRYHLPGSADLAVMLAVGFYFLSVASLPYITPGSPLWRLLSAYFPGGPEMFRWQVKMLLLPVIGIHTAEPLYLDLSRLQKHAVDRWSAQWWMWMVSCFFEGVMAFRRFDRVIAKKKVEKEAKKH
ncbi:hypothetical protein E4U53_002638 [Claviceps sorghi]|nr:hypothetical protein E4U53_002638 [Claviceps sorghi]